MKKLGLVLIVVGLLFTVITGFKFFTKEKVVDLGKVEINKSEPHKVNWSPYLGIVIMVAGGLFVVLGPKGNSM